MRTEHRTGSLRSLRHLETLWRLGEYGRCGEVPRSELVVVELLIALFEWIAEVDLAVQKVFGCNERALRQAFVVAGNLDLLTIFKGFFERVCAGGKLFELTAEVFLHLCRNLVGTLAHDDQTLINVACGFCKIHQVVRDSVGGSFRLFIIHDDVIKFLFRKEESGENDYFSTAAVSTGVE